jgi:hypothetical protein
MGSALDPPPKLERLSRETIGAIHDDDVEFSLLQYVVDHNLPSDSAVGAIAHLPEALRSWYIAFVVDAEVLNGGFNQFFFNPSGELARDAPQAFATLGLHEAGGLVQRALHLMESHAPALEQARKRGTLEAFAETYLHQPFSELDDLYCSNEEKWRLARIHFVRETLGR